MPSEANAWFTGVLVPVTTPFDPVSGDVAPVSFRDTLRRLLRAPIDGIVLFGSTGEGVLLSDEEKLDLVAYARDLIPPAMPLVGGAGLDSTRETIRQTRMLGDAGVDAVLVHAPAYVGQYLSAGQLRDHYVAIADASPVPVIVYHIPKYTKVVLEPGLIGELARHENIVGLKDSSGDVKRFADYTNLCGGHCRLLIGSGSLLYTALELGAAGGIVAVGNLAPEETAAIYRAFRAGDARTAGRLQTQISPVHNEVVKAHGAAGVKAALDLMGLIGGPPRPPLRPLKEKELRGVAQVMQQANLLP